MLNRVLRVAENGKEYALDQRHADVIIEAMAMKEAKGVLTPIEDEKAWEEKGNDE